jgi:hypothetical protein
MPAQELSFLTQTALLFPLLGIDQWGQPTVGDPVELKPPYNGVRWNDVLREVVDAEGNTVAIDAVVVVARTIAVKSRMWLGTLAEWYESGTGTGSSAPDSQLCEVKLYNETRDIKGRVATRTVSLMRLHNAGTD